MMAVDNAAASLRTDLVKLVAESTHVRSTILITCDHLIDWINNDCRQLNVAYTAYQLGNQLIQRNRMTAQVPDNDAVHSFRLDFHSFINLQKAIYTGCRINLQVHIQDLPLLAWKTKPGNAFCNADAKLHQQK